MSLPMLIGVTGFAQNGKDSIGRILGQYGYVRVGFADQLKRMALVLDPWIPGVDIDQGNFTVGLDPLEAGARLTHVVDRVGWESAKRSQEVRRLLQVLGTEAVRDIIGEDSWINALSKRLGSMSTTSGRVVVTDVRFPNEAAWIRKTGGEVWGVDRLDFDSGVPKTHSSEAHVLALMRNVDAFFANDGTLRELEEKVTRLVEIRGLPE